MDESTESGSRPPLSAKPPPLPLWPTPAHRPRLHPTVTILGWVAVGLWAVAVIGATIAGSPLNRIDRPAAAVIALGEKDLDLNAAMQAAPKWERNIYRWSGYSSGDNLPQLADGYRRVLSHLEATASGTEPPAAADALRARLVLLEAELGNAGSRDEAMDRLPSTGSAGAFVDAVIHAYDGSPAPEGAAWDLSLLTTGDSRIARTAWSHDRLLQRIAERDGDPAAAAAWMRKIRQRGERLLRRARLVETGYGLTLLAGLGATIVLFPHRRRSLAVANGIVVAPWSLRYGIAVMVRCVGAGTVLSFLLLGPLAHWATFVTALPIVFVMHYYLFRPDGSTPWHGFGLSPGAVSIRGMIFFALALAAIDQMGCLLIQNGADLIGLTPVWEEQINDTLLFGSLPAALATTVDGVVWAPLFEELAFRGLLYATLRTRLTPLPAALLSGGLFGIVHLYSLTGFVQVAWTGFILAVGYEKCRSLWPCVFAHFINNLFYFGTLLMVYR